MQFKLNQPIPLVTNIFSSFDVTTKILICKESEINREYHIIVKSTQELIENIDGKYNIKTLKKKRTKK